MDALVSRVGDGAMRRGAIPDIDLGGVDPQDVVEDLDSVNGSIRNAAPTQRPHASPRRSASLSPSTPPVLEGLRSW